ncbi:hypothetical protein [Stenomitos frigidus]|nr:hypothetical protein [Stenomitos frigidus]
MRASEWCESVLLGAVDKQQQLSTQAIRLGDRMGLERSSNSSTCEEL